MSMHVFQSSSSIQPSGHTQNARPREEKRWASLGNFGKSSITQSIETGVWTSAIVQATLVDILTTVLVIGQLGTRQTLTRARVAAHQINACVLTRPVSVSQQTFIDICSSRRRNAYRNLWVLIKFSINLHFYYHHRCITLYVQKILSPYQRHVSEWMNRTASNCCLWHACFDVVQACIICVQSSGDVQHDNRPTQQACQFMIKAWCPTFA